MGRSSIPIEDLRAIPFINHDNIRGRVLRSLCFFSEDEWHFWLGMPGGLVKVKGTPAESIYFGKKPERQDDLYLHFIDFICQRAYWPEISKPIEGLIDDVFNIGASLAKIQILREHCKDHKISGVSRMVVTEMEYLFGVCRSMFDLLQEVASGLWETIQLQDKEISKKSMPKAFSKILSENGSVRKGTDISLKYGLPKVLSSFYEETAPFFLMLRKFRDNIFHRGSSFQIVFETERGFAVQQSLKPFSEFGIWKDECMLSNGLCPLRAALAHVVDSTLSACDSFTRCLEQIILFPPPLVPGFDTFLRGYSNQELLQRKQVRDECLW